MKAAYRPSHLGCILLAATALCFRAAGQTPADPGWPRLFEAAGKQLTVYQPQVDYWKDYTKIHFRCAIAVKGVTKQETFGVAEVEATTAVDQAARVVVLAPIQRELRFPNTSEKETAALREAVDKLKPPGQPITLSLDRLLAYVDPAEQPQQAAIEVNLEPPRIFASQKPAILVMLLGEAQFKPVEATRTDLMFAINTNWDLFLDTASQRYFLLDRDTWLMAPEVAGPWTAASDLPASLSSLPADDNWAEVRQNLPGKRVEEAPAVFVSTEPAELIVTEGEPSYSPIPGTKLMRVANSDSVLFLHSGEATFYLLVAGRWFRAAALNGPWSAASRDLPADFGQIPDSDPAAFVKASVPGCREALDAVLLASVPTVTEVDIASAKPVVVAYEGEPKFKPIETTVVQVAVNTPSTVFLVDGKYFCCDQGVWFVSAAAAGPWAFCTSVPAAIYTIPPSSPWHNVTYVVVQTSTPTTVVYSQTSGYTGEYVAATGVLMFGAGMLLGAALAHDDDHYHYYYPPYPCHYSYGCGAVYHHGHGGYYYRGGAAYGPYGGAGYAAAYNPATGTYARGAYAYGPVGSASVRQAYNPYTGARARSAQISTAHGAAGRGAAYNPATGNAVRGGYRSSDYGGAAGFRTSQGAAGVAWDTNNSQGAIARTKSGDVYAGHDGTVYKKDSDGGWSQNSGSGWENVAKPQPRTAAATSTAVPNRPAPPPPQVQPSQSARPTAAAASSAVTTAAGSGSQGRQSLEKQAEARQWGNQQSQRAQSAPSFGGSSRGGSSRGGSRGGGGRNR